MWKVTAGLSALIIFAVPLSYIAEPISTGLSGAASATLLFVSTWLLRPGERDFFSTLIKPYFAVGLSAAAFILFQILPVSSLAHPVWKSAAEALDAATYGSISVAPAESVEALLLLLNAMSTLALSAAVSIEARRARWISNAVILASVAFAIMLICHHYFGQIGPQDDWAGSRANLLSILMGLPLALFRSVEAFENTSNRDKQSAIRSTLLYLGAALLIVFALSIGTSGMLMPVATAAALVILIGAFRKAGISATASTIAMVAIAVVVVTVALSTKNASNLPLTIRFALASQETIETSWNLLADTPWFGTGVGTIDFLLPTYAGRDSQSSQIASAACAAMADVGAPAFWIGCAMGAMTSLAFYSGALIRGRDWSFPASAAATIPSILVAAFILPFQISSESVLMLSAVVGMGAAQRMSRARMAAEQS